MRQTIHAGLAAVVFFIHTPLLYAAPARKATKVTVVRLNGPEDEQRLAVPKGPPMSGTKTFLALSDDDFFVARLSISPGSKITQPAHLAELFGYVLRGRGTLRVGDASSALEPGAILLSPQGAPLSLSASEPMIIIGVVPGPRSAGSDGAVFQKHLASELRRFEILPAEQKHRKTPLISGGAISVDAIQLNAAPGMSYRAKTRMLLLVTRGALAIEFADRTVQADVGTILRVPAGERYGFRPSGGHTAVLLAISVL